jgi:hypothetical protein
MARRLSAATIAPAALAGMFLLSGCGGTEQANLAQMDNQIAAADIDPAVSTAIEDQILVDPALVQQSNPNGLRHPERPLQAPYPPAVAGTQPASAPLPSDPEAPIAGACGGPFQYGPEWANRLPAEFPAYPGGRLTEAAGNNNGDCRYRVVTFTTEHNPQQVLDWYRGTAARAGYNAEHQVRGADHVLAGANERTNGAYFLVVTPQAASTQVALIVNNGR